MEYIMDKIEELKNHLQSKFLTTLGDERLIDGRTSYEKKFADAINATLSTGTYYDCHLEINKESVKIELKASKTGNFWLNLLTYCKIFDSSDDKKEIITLFIIYDDKSGKVNEIFIVTMAKLIEKLHIEKIVDILPEINDLFKRNINAQARLTKKDIKEITEYSVVNLHKDYQ